jgi:glutathionyl-hydroquinone reductase
MTLIYTTSITMGSVYIIQEREFIKLNEPVYKIGRTKQSELYKDQMLELIKQNSELQQKLNTASP